LFEKAAAALSAVGPRALRRPGGSQVNVAQAEAILVGLMHAINSGNPTSDIEGALNALVEDDKFVLATTRATADKDAVGDRLSAARAALGA
jgi:hypothetical protein